MLKLAIKILIILLVTANALAVIATPTIIIFLLMLITTSALNQYYKLSKLTLILTASYTMVALFYPLALTFLPVLFVDVATHFPPKYTFFLPLILTSLTAITQQATFFGFLTGVTALMLTYMLERLAEFDIINKEIRDLNALQKKALLTKNQQLYEGQTEAIYLTKLAERNRIARDIHDTIGHSLSRALLQTGALAAMNQNEALKPAIAQLKATLIESMNAVRKGVHDLKDDSIDLQSAIAQILAESDFKTTFNYDVFGDVTHVVKNCLLAILKESLTNSKKHSDATQIFVRIVEHPRMYQFLIVDNGTKKPTLAQNQVGIGLQNIKERISELKGYCRIEHQDGFKIFITIPKEKELPTL